MKQILRDSHGSPLRNCRIELRGGDFYRDQECTEKHPGIIILDKDGATNEKVYIKPPDDKKGGP